MAECLGMVEVRGFLGAVAVADAALKAANVRLASSEKIKGGITTILLSGDVGAVTASVEAAALVGKEIGAYRSHHVIPRPDAQTDECFINPRSTLSKIASSESKVIKEETVIEVEKASSEEVRPEKVSSVKSELEAMKVVDLRKLALKTEAFPLNSKEIKYSNKAQLVKAFEELKNEGGEN